MRDQEIQKLLQHYVGGKLSEEQRAQLERLIEDGVIQLDELQDVKSLSDAIQSVAAPEPSGQLDRKFHEMLKEEQGKVLKSTPLLLSGPWMRWAAVGILFLVGVAIGRYTISEKREDRVEILSSQIGELKEMVMLSLLEKDAATERLRAVNLTHDMNNVSFKVTGALLETLNHDENINVRLAALEALVPYANQDTIRVELVRSIAKQTSPLVQVALAELMVALQEKSSVDELRKLLHDENTPEDVKERIHKNIETLI